MKKIFASMFLAVIVGWLLVAAFVDIASPPDLQALNARTAVLYVEYEDTAEGEANSMSGAGILLDSGQVLTAGHLFRGGVTGEGIFYPAQTFTFVRTPAKVYVDGVDATLLMVYGAPELKPKLKVRCTPPQAGESVFSITYPSGGYGPMLLRGSVASFAPVFDEVRYAITGFEIHPGMSGSPIFDDEGRILGVLATLTQFFVGGFATFVPTASIEAVCPKEQT